MSEPGLPDRRPGDGPAWFHRHAVVFAGVITAALFLEWITDADWPLFWPILVWSVALGLHYFLTNALNVDQTWVEERTADLLARSYDFDHIRDIEKRIDEKDASLVAHAERDREDADKT
jgi:hypothetical protein